MSISLASEPSSRAHRIHLELSAEYPLVSHGDLSLGQIIRETRDRTLLTIQDVSSQAEPYRKLKN